MVQLRSNGKKIVDFIGRYENLQTDLQKIYKKINHNIDNFNTGQKHRRTTRDKDYKKYYISDKMINIVGDLFHKDIVTFGDKFNDWLYFTISRVYKQRRTT